MGRRRFVTSPCPLSSLSFWLSSIWVTIIGVIILSGAGIGLLASAVIFVSPR